MDIADYTVLESIPKYKGIKVKVNTQKIRTCEGKIVEWDKVMTTNIAYALPITAEQEAILVQEWRPGPEKVLTQLCGARYTDGNGLNELKKELTEEIGIQGGEFSLLIKDISNGPHLGGFKIIYQLKDFSIESTHPEENEIIKIVKIPVKYLFQELSTKYLTTAETLLVAKMLEDGA